LRLFILLAGWRLLSLIIVAESKSYGRQQLTWFFEGVFFLLSMLLLFSRFNKILDFFLRVLFYIGLASIGVMVIQFLFVSIGIIWTLPLSTSVYGQSQDLILRYGYPMIAGRIIGAFSDSNMSGTMCAFYFASFFPLNMFKMSSRFTRRWLLLAAILAVLIAVVGTGSRQAMLAILISFIVVVYFRVKSGISVTLKRLAPIVLLSAFLLYFGTIYFTRNIENATGTSPQTVINRLKAGGDWTGGRFRFIQKSLHYITFKTFFVGMGEGMTFVNLEEAPHNAYLITLLEVGIIGLLILLSLSLVLLYYPYKALRRKMGESPAVNMAIFCISLTCVLLILANWAQLNQSISYPYLSLALM